MTRERSQYIDDMHCKNIYRINHKHRHYLVLYFWSSPHAVFRSMIISIHLSAANY